jgi:membrane peptidoglycan carboxypeptidase
VVNRTITPDVAAELTAIMEGVVDRGTATTAQIAGYTVAGKTGTAAKLINGHYSKSDYNASFVGFVPSRKPAFTIIVVTDSAHGPHGAFGGPVSGPVFKRIAEAALRYYGVPPTINPPPPLLVARHEEEVLEQPASIPIEAPAVITTVNAVNGSTVPDLAGMSARDALRVLARLGIASRLRGTGVVVQQQPAAGTAVDPDVTATLWLERQPAVRLASEPTP